MKIEKFGTVTVSEDGSLTLENFSFVEAGENPTPRDLLLCVAEFITQHANVIGADVPFTILGGHWNHPNATSKH